MELYYPLNSFRLCIDDHSYRIYSPLMEKETECCDLGKLILKIDKLFDSNNYPRAFQEKRSFNEKVNVSSKPKCKYSLKMLLLQEGGIGTFDIVVVSRQHSTWQGIVKDIQGNMAQSLLLWENDLLTV